MSMSLSTHMIVCPDTQQRGLMLIRIPDREWDQSHRFVKEYLVVRKTDKESIWPSVYIGQGVSGHLSASLAILKLDCCSI